MNNDEAKKILALYRPATADRNDPVFKAAAELAKIDVPPGQLQEKPNPELANWFKDHCSSYLSIRTKFLKVPVPADLKERILAGQPAPAVSKIIPFNPAILWRAAAAIVVLIGLSLLLWRPHGQQEDDFNTYRNRMARTAMQPYGMPVQTHDLKVIQAFLSKHQAPANYALPDGISKAQPIGCAIERWQGAPVSMLCFHTGQSTAAAEKPDLWLFVVDQATVKNAPEAASPIFNQAASLATATWTRDGKTYILAAAGDEAFLRKYL